MTIDLSEFERKRDTRCVIGKFRDELDEADREKLDAALDADHISLIAIADWLQKRGLKTSPATVRTHRLSRCRCD
jgi:hypothetical protein